MEKVFARLDSQIISSNLVEHNFEIQSVMAIPSIKVAVTTATRTDYMTTIRVTTCQEALANHVNPHLDSSCLFSERESGRCSLSGLPPPLILCSAPRHRMGTPTLTIQSVVCCQ